MLVVDGLGGLRDPATGKSELETAGIPNLDALARQSSCGLTTPVLPGITPGSGPGHTSLFGYDPVKYLMGRGVLEALGSGVQLSEGDVAARGNLCTVAEDGTITDRRAGRLPTSESEPLLRRLGRDRPPRSRGLRLSGARPSIRPRTARPRPRRACDGHRPACRRRGAADRAAAGSRKPPRPPIWSTDSSNGRVISLRV